MSTKITLYHSDPAKIVSLNDLEKVAMPRAAKMVREYWESGANDQQTLQENILGFDQYRIRTKVLVDVSNVSLKPAKLFGKQYDVPIGIAPAAFHRLATDEGEVATAKAAKSRNWAMGLSSYSTRTLEDVKEAGGDNVAFLQLYVFQNKETSEKLVRRAEKAGYKAIALTVDTPAIGMRYANMYSEFKLPSYVSLANFGDGVDNPINPSPYKTKDDGTPQAPVVNTNTIDSALTWKETIPWLRSITNLEIWLKGVATAEDAEEAVKAGVDGIWVSNHGGRQLDSTLSTIDSLPEVVEAVKGRIPVHVDGGIRRGGDVFKMLALGADFVWLGRPVLYGLLYDGQQGLDLMQSILEKELEMTMMMAGTTSIDQIDKTRLARRGPRFERL